MLNVSCFEISQFCVVLFQDKTTVGLEDIITTLVLPIQFEQGTTIEIVNYNGQRIKICLWNVLITVNTQSRSVVEKLIVQ